MRSRRWPVVILALLVVAAGWWELHGNTDEAGPVDAAATGRTSRPGQAVSSTGSGQVVGDAVLTAPASPDAPGSGLRVSIFASGQQLAGAEVQLFRRVERSADWLAMGGGSTDAAGAITLAAPPGDYLVTATGSGFARGYRPFIRPANEPLTQVRLDLIAGAALRGRVVARRSLEPVPQAAVALSPTLGPSSGRQLPLPDLARLTAVTDGRGLFLFDHVAPGRWRLEARAVGHAHAVLSDLAVPRPEDLRIELATTAAIEGTVTQGGAPVASALVRITGLTASVEVQSSRTGGYAAEVDPGSHHVTAEVPGAVGAAPHAILVAAGQTVRGVDVALGAPSTLAGTVTDASGPVAGALVVAAPFRETGGAVRTTSGADGSYQLPSLAPGTYAVKASQGGRSSADVGGVVVAPAARFHLDLALPAPTAIEGQVTEGNGPVAGALVTALDGWMRRDAPLAAPTALSARTDVAGKYRIDGVGAGRLRVAARRDERSPLSLESVDVEEGQTARVDLKLVSGGVLGGTVREVDGTPVPGALVAVLGQGPMPGGGLNQATADGDGAYLLPLPPGRHQLTAVRPELASLRLGRPAILGVAEVAMGQRSDLDLVLPPRPPGSVSGRVVEPGWAASAGASVWSGGPGAGLLLANADGEGMFTLPATGTDPVTVQGRNGGRTGATSVTPPQADVVLQLMPAAVIRGTLVGDPAPETFELTASVRGPPIWNPGNRLQFSGASFELDDQVPGQVALHVKSIDGRIGDASVAVAAGETATASVSLSPAATVTGRLVDAATGQPVARARVLLDGQYSRRGAVASDGTFSRIMGTGAHSLVVSAIGYHPLTVAVTARAEVPTDLGDVKLEAAAPQAGR
jgi:hypothetical protein